MSELPFTVLQERHGNLPLVRVCGEVDISTAALLKEAIVLALQADHSSLAIDLSEVGFLDSSGLQVLMSAKRRTAERGGEVYIVGMKTQVRRVFSLVGLQKIFRVCREKDLPQA